MKKCIKKRLISVLLMMALVLPLFAVNSKIDAKETVKLAKKSVSVSVGETKKVKVTTKGVKKVVKVSAKSSAKSVAKVKAAKNAVSITGKKAGKATISATVKYKVKAKGKTLSKKLSCKVNVLDKSDDKGADASAATATPAKSTDNTKVTPPTPTPIPNWFGFYPDASPGPTRTPGPENLLGAFSEYTKNVGVCLDWKFYESNPTIADADTKAVVKENFNSITAENNNKPNIILGNSANLISVSSAQNQGIIIPEGYTEANVPKLNYSNIDVLMKFCADNGLRMRYHALLWHEQTSNWWFRENYSSSAAFVTPEIMDKRIEYFIMNVIEHISTSQYADVVYAYDVVNEFYHMEECIWKINEGKKNKTEEVKCYYEVYGEEIFTNPDDPAHYPVVDNPRYVKMAFKCAHDMLKKYDLVDKVELVYNDYDTHLSDVCRSILAVTSFINAKDELNPDGEKLVTTIGMQCHEKLADDCFVYGDSDCHEVSMTKYAKTGLNLQITELDVTQNGEPDEESIKYWEDFTRLVITLAKKGAKFTSLTIWGLTDELSWRGPEEKPLLFRETVKDVKPAYYAVIDAAYSV